MTVTPSIRNYVEILCSIILRIYASSVTTPFYMYSNNKVGVQYVCLAFSLINICFCANILPRKIFS